MRPETKYKHTILCWLAPRIIFNAIQASRRKKFHLPTKIENLLLILLKVSLSYCTQFNPPPPFKVQCFALVSRHTQIYGELWRVRFAHLLDDCLRLAR